MFRPYKISMIIIIKRIYEARKYGNKIITNLNPFNAMGDGRNGVPLPRPASK